MQLGRIRCSMTQQSVFHLEPFARFVHRVVDLNRLHSPEDPLHDALALDGSAWHEFVEAAGPDVDAAVAARKDLALIHEGFPNGEPVHEQAAYLVRAFSAARPFAEANHRTGWDYVSELLEHNGFALLASVDEGRGLGNDVWDQLREVYPNGAQPLVHESDGVSEYLLEWFQPRIARNEPA